MSSIHPRRGTKDREGFLLPLPASLHYAGAHEGEGCCVDYRIIAAASSYLYQRKANFQDHACGVLGDNPTVLPRFPRLEAVAFSYLKHFCSPHFGFIVKGSAVASGRWCSTPHYRCEQYQTGFRLRLGVQWLPVSGVRSSSGVYRSEPPSA
jgi:hypothetical protein